MDKLEELLERLRGRSAATADDAEVVAEAAVLLRDLRRIQERADGLARRVEGAPEASAHDRVGERAVPYGPVGSLAGLPLHDAAKFVLAGARMPMHVRDIGRRIKTLGWRHPRATNAKPEQIQLQLASRLPRHPETFRRVAPNTFALREWGDVNVVPKRRKPKFPLFSADVGDLNERMADNPGTMFEEERGPWRL